MAKKSIKQTFEGNLNFNHVDPHFARFKVERNPVKAGQSELYGLGAVNITPEMFPADFELAKYNVTGSYVLTVEITSK